MTVQDMDIETNEIADDASSETRVYELGFHLDPELPSEEVKKAYGSIRALVAEKGVVIAEGEPQNIQLAYTISCQNATGRRDFNSAYFCWIAYEASARNHSEIISAANVDKRIVRFIDLLTTKDAARYSVELHELLVKTPERVNEPEETLAVEIDAALENAVV